MSDDAPTPKPPLTQIGRPFVKGKSGNPGGRPKELAEFRQLLREKKAHKALRCLMDEIGTRGDDCVKAAEIVLAYAWGKPTQGVEFSGKDGGAIPIEVKPNVEPSRTAAILQVLAAVGVLPAGADALGTGEAGDAEADEVHPPPAAPDTGRLPPAE